MSENEAAEEVRKVYQQAREYLRMHPGPDSIKEYVRFREAAHRAGLYGRAVLNEVRNENKPYVWPSERQ